MSDRIFLDTNVLVYACTISDSTKQQKATQLFEEYLGQSVFISTQVLSELYSALKKSKIDDSIAKQALLSYADSTNVVVITIETIRKSLDLRSIYGYSYWDCLIIATALCSNCSILYSEDLQDDQLINGKVQIVNPFK
jgi:predicted nucleic acid-binding protein